jgi:hypothetical protein
MYAYADHGTKGAALLESLGAIRDPKPNHFMTGRWLVPDEWFDFALRGVTYFTAADGRKCATYCGGVSHRGSTFVVPHDSGAIPHPAEVQDWLRS